MRPHGFNNIGKMLKRDSLIKVIDIASSVILREALGSCGFCAKACHSSKEKIYILADLQSVQQ